MSAIFDYLKAASGESSLLGRLGSWRQAASLTIDQLVELVQNLSGGGLLPATGTTTGSRPLSGYATALLQTGDEVFVQGINEVYYFDAASALTADGLNVVNAVGPGQFLRGSTVLARLDWYVDFASGNDQNVGSAVSPLKTLEELQKRWESRRTLGAATINLIGTSTEALILNSVLGGNVTIQASASLVYAGTVGAYQAQAAPATDARITDAGIGAAGGWGANLQRRLRLTSGANSGALAWILKDLGGNTARITTFTSPTTGTAVNASIGDSYVIETLPVEIAGFQVMLQGGGFSCTLKDFALRPGASVGSFGFVSGGGSSLLTLLGMQILGASSFNLGGGSYLTMRACSNVNQMFLGKSGIQNLAGHAAFNAINVQQGGSVRFSGAACAFQAARLIINLYGQSDWNLDLAFYDVSTAAPVTIAEGSTFSGAGSTASQLWGINNTGAFYGVNVNAGGRLVWRQQPTITSGTGDVIVGGSAQTWVGVAALAQSSYLNPNNGASAGLRQV